MHRHTNPIRSLFYYLWSIFLNGFLTLLPITLTIALFRFSIRLIKGWLEPLNSLLEATIFAQIPHSEIIVVVVFIMLVGILMRNFILRSLINTLEAIVSRIPLVRPVYTGFKQLVQALGAQNGAPFKKVVLVEFPRAGVYSIGFLTSDFPAQFAPSSEQLCNVFIPTTPNPTAGFLIAVPYHTIKVIDMTRQEAMTMIMSGGIILPSRSNIW